MGRLDLPDPPTGDLTVTKEFLHELYGEVAALRDILTPEQRQKVNEIKARPGWKPNDGRAQFEPVFSEREIEILQHVAEGGNSRSIGLQLGLSSWTITSHLNNMLEKTGAHTRAQLVWVLHSRLTPFR